jgi:uncharacterized protein YdhG (YjbR/CyaY superfamily)
MAATFFVKPEMVRALLATASLSNGGHGESSTGLHLLDVLCDPVFYFSLSTFYFACIVANMTASTVAQYLAALPADRRAALSAVRKAINENLPDGYEEGMQFGMIGWYVPLSVYPAGYGENPKVPLSFVALASQKSGMVLHFLCFYGHPTLSTWFTSEYKKSGKKLDMGKGCVRFKSLEDLALDVVGRTVARVSAEEHMANYQAARALLGKGRNAGEGAAGLSKSSAKKGARKSAVKKAKPKK